MGKAKTDEIILNMKQTSNGFNSDFEVYDDQKNKVYAIHRKMPAYHYTITKEGEDVIILSQKAMSLKKEYIFEAGGKEVLRLKKKVKLVKVQYIGEYNGKELAMESTAEAKKFDITLGGTPVGHVDCTEHGYQDRYRIRVYDEQLQDILVALTILCDKEADDFANIK